jgi:predicted ribosomally synthesized peptide with SipW-like signal peptide
MLNKRIATGFMSIAGALAIAGGATFAYFTDTAVSAGNSFQAGSLDINIKDTEEEMNAPFDVEGMMPGESEYRYITIVNDGTEDMKWRAYISGGDGGELFNALRVKSMILHPTDFTSYDELDGYTIAGPEDHIVVSSANPIPFNQLLDPDTTPLQWVKGENGTVDAFESKWAAVYKVEVELDPEADNSYNGKSWSGDMTFYATQDNNTGW